jgi:hypothetical protein
VGSIGVAIEPSLGSNAGIGETIGDIIESFPEIIFSSQVFELLMGSSRGDRVPAVLTGTDSKGLKSWMNNDVS